MFKFTPEQRAAIAEIIETVADHGLSSQRDLDVTLDAIQSVLAE